MFSFVYREHIVFDEGIVKKKSYYITAVVAQWVKILVPQAEGWVFESELRQT